MFTIGEFSRLCHVSPRMLRYYDAMDLLQPASVGKENGYRYYDEKSLETLRKIEMFKDYGFSLAEIKELLSLPEQALAKRMHVRRLKAYAQLNELRESLRGMEDAIIKMEGTAMSLEKYNVILMEVPAQTVFGLRRTINVSQTHQLFEDLYAEMKKRGIRRAGVTQLLYYGKTFSYDAMDVEAQAQVSGEDPALQNRPPMTCAAVMHTGPYESLKYAYDALGAWFMEHEEYQVCGPAVERYIKDEQMVHSREELETGVLFPVMLVKKENGDHKTGAAAE